ncbi:MAG: hypothetical protein SGJ20_08395 [Planctomycetota bacterium]|nr:hypothetical protein [Planctomycetota bacterium]
MPYLLAEYSSQQIAILFGIGIAIFFLSIRIRRQFKAASEPSSLRSTTGSGISTASSSTTVRKSSNPLAISEAMQVELHDLVRQSKAEIDSKMIALQQLIRMADDAVSRLEAAIDHAESLGLVEQSTGDTKDTVAGLASRSESHNSSWSGQSRRQNAPTAAGRVYAGKLNLPDALEDDPRYERVFALADAGFTSARIASQVGMQVGEVELILSLRPAKKSEL